MSIRFRAPNPAQLLDSFKKAIKDGKITTWTCNTNGDFTHKADQWKNKAWLRPTTTASELVFKILPPQGSTVSTVVYGYYHGHIIETMLTHFDDQFYSADASATVRDGDQVNAA